MLGLVVDHEGVLWVRMQSPYLTRYRGGSFEQMYPAKLPPVFTFAREEGAAAAARGTRGDALIAPPDAPLRYVAGKFTPVVSSGAVHGIPMSIAETADGAVWVGMRDTGLFRIRDGRGSQVGLPDQKVNVLLPVAGPKLWIGTDSGLVAMGRHRDNASRCSAPHRAQSDSGSGARSRFQPLDLDAGRNHTHGFRSPPFMGPP